VREPPAFQEVVAALMALVALGVTAFLAVRGSEPMAGVLGAVVAAAVGYFLRGRVAQPSTDPQPQPPNQEGRR
jgi:hypothetical protein